MAEQINEKQAGVQILVSAEGLLIAIPAATLNQIIITYKAALQQQAKEQGPQLQALPPPRKGSGKRNVN